MTSFRDIDISTVKKKLYEAFCIILWGGVFFNLLRISSEIYDSPRQIHFNRAFLCFMAVLIVIRKVRLINFPIITTIITSLGVIITYLTRHNGDWGEIWRKALIAKYLFFVLFAVIVIDMIRSQNYLRLKNYSISSLMCLLITHFIIALVDFENILVLTAGCAVWYLTPIKSDEWKKQLKLLSIGGYFAFAYLFLRSNITNPESYSGSRFVGNFTYPVAAGMAATTGLVCAVYYLVAQILNKKNFKIIIPISLAVILPICFQAMIMNRASIVGIILIIVLAFVFLGKQKKNTSLIKGLSTIVAFLLLTVLGLVAMKKISELNIDTDQFSGSIGKILKLIVGKANYSFDFGDRYSMFEEGSYMNALDNFSSHRITLWIQGLKTAKLLPVEDFGVYYPGGAYMPHAHNQFICFIRKYGYLGGLPITVAHFYMLVLSIKGVKKDKLRFLLTFMWMAYSIGLLMFEYKGWNMMPYGMMVILLHPLLQKQDEQLD